MDNCRKKKNNYDFCDYETRPLQHDYSHMSWSQPHARRQHSATQYGAYGSHTALGPKGTFAHTPLQVNGARARPHHINDNAEQTCCCCRVPCRNISRPLTSLSEEGNNTSRHRTTQQAIRSDDQRILDRAAGSLEWSHDTLDLGPPSHGPGTNYLVCAVAAK